MRLSTLMREALAEAAKQPLRRTHDDHAGKPAWPAHPASLHALVRAGLLEHTERRNKRGYRVEVWTITDAGVDALNPAPRYRPDRPVFLADRRRSQEDYTSNPARAIDHLEVIKGETVSRFAAAARERELAQRRQNGLLLDTTALEDRMAQARHAAKERRMDITGDLWVIRRMLELGREQAAARRLVRIETQLQVRAA